MSIAYTPRTETVVILQGDDDEKLRSLRAFAASLDPERTRKRVLLTEADPQADYDEACRVANDFAKEAAERGIAVVLRSVGRKTWRDLIAKHPARDDNDTDKSAGVNLDTLPEDLIPACMGSPTFDNIEEQSAFLDSLSEAEFGRLGQVAWLLNTRTSADPKAVLGSKPTPT